MNKLFWLNALDRIGWTFVQALGGSVAAGSTAATLGTFDWRAALIGAATAAVLCALKVLGVSVSVKTSTSVPSSGVVVSSVPTVPASVAGPAPATPPAGSTPAV